MQTAHLVGIGACEQDFLTLRQRQNITFVLQKNHRLLSGLQRSLGKLVRAELLIALSTCIGLLKKAQTILGTQDTAHSIVNTRHLYLALIHKFLQQDAELHAIGIHRHVDTCIDSDADGIFLVLGHMFAREEVVDISPVCHEEAVPLKILLQPLGEILITGMYGHAIDRSRVHHHRQRSCKGCSLEGLKILLTDHLRRQVGRRTVLT